MGRRGGGVSLHEHIRVCASVCVSVCVCGIEMKRETDRQNCMSWLVSCSLIRMQISCIEKHLGAFLSPFSTLHSSPPFSSLCLVCQIQLSTFIFPHFSSPLFSSLIPPHLSFPPLSPSAVSDFYLTLTSPPALTLPSLLSCFPSAKVSFPVPLLPLSLPQPVSQSCLLLPLFISFKWQWGDLHEAFQCGCVVRRRI